MVPELADIELAANPYIPNGTTFEHGPIEWGSGAEGPGVYNQPDIGPHAQSTKRAYYAAAAFSDHQLGLVLAEKVAILIQIDEFLHLK